MLRLGDASYALYLIHAPLSVYFQKALEGARFAPLAPAWNLALYVGVTVSVSVAIFRWVEDPARKYLRHKGSRFTSRAVVSLTQSPADAPP